MTDRRRVSSVRSNDTYDDYYSDDFSDDDPMPVKSAPEKQRSPRTRGEIDRHKSENGYHQLVEFSVCRCKSE